MDQITISLPDSLERDRFIVATYYCATGIKANIWKYAAALAIEQTTGTWVKVLGETDEVREMCAGHVIGAYEAPAYQIGLPGNTAERHNILRIAYPWKNFGTSLSMLLSTVIGNISSSGKVKLLDLEFPAGYLRNFPGPKFGVDGLRKLLGVEKRPLLNNMIKPCTGLSPEATAQMAYEAAVGGVDIIKDDELVCDPPHCPLVERVKSVMAAPFMDIPWVPLRAPELSVRESTALWPDKLCGKPRWRVRS